MRFATPLLFGTLLQRYQRFLADVRLESGEHIAAHCPNSGSMKGVNVPGARVAVSHHPSPTRRLQYTWELIHLEGGWVGVNTLIPNRLAADAFETGLIPRFRRYVSYRSEAKIAADTRIDFVMGAAERMWVEVKNVTLVEAGVAKFPDSVTTRGAKHLEHLTRHARTGGRSAMLYVCQHHAAERFTSADEIDPTYGALLRRAVAAGVAVEVWIATVTPEEIRLRERLPFQLT
ncbi:DNA/RNA nuclease SfsA [candidate division KSB1 bacterium]|nr:DNA/RNA nuclease SfsA [candidate division KSB1 bacterium]